METTTNKQTTFKGIAGLKVLAAFYMFIWHSPAPRPPVDLGARLCEFFFVVSGFLFFISNASKTDTQNWSNVGNYMKKKFIRMWPVHFTGFVAAVFLLPKDILLLPQTLINAVLNLFWLQSWVNNDYVFFGFNGVSWYLSSLFFCYLFGFFLLKQMRQSKTQLGLAFILFALRYAMEAIPMVFPGQFWSINAHVFPPARALEFGLGMVTAATFMRIYNSSKGKITVTTATLLEIASFVTMITIMVQLEGKWIRAAYIIPFCILVACFGFDNGLISRFFSIRPIQWLSKFQLEIYMFHQLSFRWIEYKYPLQVQMLIYICVMIMVIAVHRTLIQPNAEKLLKKYIN